MSDPTLDRRLNLRDVAKRRPAGPATVRLRRYVPGFRRDPDEPPKSKGAKRQDEVNEVIDARFLERADATAGRARPGLEFRCSHLAPLRRFGDGGEHNAAGRPAATLEAG